MPAPWPPPAVQEPASCRSSRPSPQASTVRATWYLEAYQTAPLSVSPVDLAGQAVAIQAEPAQPLGRVAHRVPDLRHGTAAATQRRWWRG